MTSEILFALVVVLFLVILVWCIRERRKRHQTTQYASLKPATLQPQPLNPAKPQPQPLNPAKPQPQPPILKSPVISEPNRFNAAFLPINSAPQRII
jgi:hypothetical protein